MPPSRDSYQFGRSEMLDYFSALDEALSGGPPVHLIVCGGASMMWRYDDRLSSDVDVINSLLDDRTRQAVVDVGKRFGIHHDWMNDSVSRHQVLPHFEQETHVHRTEPRSGERERASVDRHESSSRTATAISATRPG